jgi:hypothetical protein
LIDNINSRVELSNINSKVLKSRKEAGNEEKVYLPRRNPTFSEEYFKNSSNYTKNVKEMKLKNATTKMFKIDRNTFIENSEKYLMKTKLIYLPFLMVFMIYFYDYTITALGVYLKIAVDRSILFIIFKKVIN